MRSASSPADGRRVVDLLELVKVQHGYGIHFHELPQLLLKEAAVIGVGQDIMVEVMMVVKKLLCRVGLPGSAIYVGTLSSLHREHRRT
mgnify:CR=1 FL=1